MIVKKADTIRYDIFIAGDYSQAEQICRRFCFDAGLCVTVEAIKFIYTGGEETGVRVGLINYPRFPSSGINIMDTAVSLATALMEGMCQHSFSVVGPEVTEWFSRRPESE